jgi:hypothetical protein
MRERTSLQAPSEDAWENTKFPLIVNTTEPEQLVVPFTTAAGTDQDEHMHHLYGLNQASTLVSQVDSSVDLGLDVAAVLLPASS